MHLHTPHATRTHARIHTHTKIHTHTHTHARARTHTQVVPHPATALPRPQIVERALSLEGQTGYNLLSKNCEHVVLWCITGEEFSQQVDRLTKDPIGLGLTILQEQAEAGAPLRLDEVCRMFLPPPLLQAAEAAAGAADSARTQVPFRPSVCLSVCLSVRLSVYRSIY